MLKVRLLSLSFMLLIITSIAGCDWNSNTDPVSKAPGETEVISVSSGQYDLKSIYLKNPNLIIDIADKSAEFWKNSLDQEHGGVFTNVNRDGGVDKKTTLKVSFIQSRNAYGFVRAYQLTGKREYLDYARNGLDFLYSNAWDKVNGGWYQEMNLDGTLAPRLLDGMPWNSIKWSFNQMNTLSGISAMYEATRNKTDELWLAKSYSTLDEKMWDKRPGYEGYFEKAAGNWSNLEYKGIASTNEAIISHAETMYLLGLEDKYKERMLAIADNINDHIVKSMDARKFGYNDRFDSDWNELESQPVTNSGNFLTPAWCLARAYLVDSKPQYKAGAEKLINEIYNSEAYDKTYGGYYSLLDPNTGTPKDDKKSWWILSQALTSGLANYYISGNSNYLKMADESIDFFMKYMYDPQYGDAYSEVNRDGTNPNMVKSSYWKDSFHTFELFYYTYLYGNLMLYEKPVSLYYYIESAVEGREIILAPVVLGKKKLIIESVTLNGRVYRDFDSSKALLKVPANTGGEFKVTFGIR